MKKIKIISILIGLLFFKEVESQLLFPKIRTTVKYECIYTNLIATNEKPVKFSLISQYIPVYENGSVLILKCINFPFLKFEEFDLKSIKQLDSSYMVVLDNKLYYYSAYKEGYIKLINRLLDKKISDSAFIKSIKQMNLVLFNADKKVSRYDDASVFPNFSSEKISNSRYKLSFKTRNDYEEAIVEAGFGFVSMKYTWERVSAYEVSIKRIE